MKDQANLTSPPSGQVSAWEGSCRRRTSSPPETHSDTHWPTRSTRLALLDPHIGYSRQSARRSPRPDQRQRSHPSTCTYPQRRVATCRPPPAHLGHPTPRPLAEHRTPRGRDLEPTRRSPRGLGPASRQPKLLGCRIRFGPCPAKFRCLGWDLSVLQLCHSHSATRPRCYSGRQQAWAVGQVDLPRPEGAAGHRDGDTDRSDHSRACQTVNATRHSYLTIPEGLGREPGRTLGGKPAPFRRGPATRRGGNGRP